MCFYGGCASLTCEKCRPKLVTCPNCGKNSFLQFDVCIFCKTKISEEVKEAARAKWYALKDRSNQVLKENCGFE